MLGGFVSPTPHHIGGWGGGTCQCWPNHVLVPLLDLVGGPADFSEALCIAPLPQGVEYFTQNTCKLPLGMDENRHLRGVVVRNLGKCFEWTWGRARLRAPKFISANMNETSTNIACFLSRLISAGLVCLLFC